MMRTALVCLLFTLCSCLRIAEQPLDFQDNPPIVWAILSPDAPIRVYCSATDAQSEVYLQKNTQPRYRLMAIEGDSVFGLPDAENSFIEPACRYRLSIFLNSGEELSAETIVPNSPSPLTNARCILQDTAALYYHAWMASFQCEWTIQTDEQPAYYRLIANDTELTYKKEGAIYRASTPELLVAQEEDSTMVRLLRTDCHLDAYWRHCQLVEDYDDNELFLRVVINHFGGIFPSFSNINGGIGLFGSYVDSCYLFPIEQAFQ